MTALRTSKGVNLKNLSHQFGEKYLSYILQNISQFTQEGMAEIQDNRLVLSNKGKLYCDQISQSLFYIP
jgi:coproporphyrinogen III oxidase-like Fe-S oxidoreductase